MLTIVAIIPYRILTYICIEGYLGLVYKYTYIYISYSDLLLPTSISHSTVYNLSYAHNVRFTERLSKIYFWPSLRRDIRHTLNDCSVCEVDKARRNEAHGLFRAQPVGPPRARYAMDFQGQGKALTGEAKLLVLLIQPPGT
jgi:hypothetical protein